MEHAARQAHTHTKMEIAKMEIAKTEIDSEAPLRQNGQKAPLMFLSKDGIVTQLRVDVDVVLSLKNPSYKAIMLRSFQKLGDKRKNADRNNEEEKKVAKAVLHLFKQQKGGELVRFFKPEARYSSRCFTEVDDKYALEKITADIYRRMESATGANGWMDNLTECEDATNRKSPPPQDPGALPSLAAKEPAQPAASAKPSPLKSAKKTKKRKLKKVPHSLPFLSNTIVADIIVEEELRAKKTGRCADELWQPDEVIHFFRALYVHGWEDWKKISKMVTTRSSQEIKFYALHLEKQFPELRKFFSSKKVHKMQEKHGVKVKRYGSAAPSSGGAPRRALPVVDSSGGLALRSIPSPNDPAMIAASVMEKMKQQAPRPPKPKVVICLGEHIIDTEAEPSLIQRFVDRKRSAETLPDEYDPSVRPSVPTNSQQVYIPGNKVYARWLNKDDPASYGTWYPGLIFASKIAPIQDEYNYTGVHNLLYHVKFDDGAESLDLDTEDIIMWNHYELWLKDLEQYYSLPWPVSDEVNRKRLTKNTKVYAKWVDPTDPELHGSWMPGKIHSSKSREGNANQRKNSYHILFDNGDQDVALLDADVIEEESYTQLLREKMERGRKKSRLCGFDLIAQASKISSPIKSDPTHKGLLTGVSAKRKLYSDDADLFNGDSLVADLRCTEKLVSKTPSPTRVARISSTPSPDVHYGIYMTNKPWELKSSVAKEQFTYAISDEPSDFQESQDQILPTDVTSASYLDQECLSSPTQNSVVQDQLFGVKPVPSQAGDSRVLLEETSNQVVTTQPSSDSQQELVTNQETEEVSNTLKTEDVLGCESRYGAQQNMPLI